MLSLVHTHVIQPVKWVKSKRDNHQTLVAYSLGNFLNGQNTGDEHNQLLGRLNFDIVKAPKGAHIENVKWTSMVNHYQQWILPIKTRDMILKCII